MKTSSIVLQTAVLCGLSSAICGLQAQTTSDQLVPEDTCVVDLDLPEDATVTVDGRDYGTKRQLEFKPLQRGQIYSAQMAIGFPDGSREHRELLLKGSWRVPLAVAAPGSARPEMMTQTGHSAWVTTVAFSPDGRYVLTGAEDNMVILWDGDSGRQLRRFAGHTERILHVAFSPSGKEILTAADGMYVDQAHFRTGDPVILWDTTTGRKIRTFGEPGFGACHAAFRPNGTQVLTASGKGVVLWDIVSGRQLRTFGQDATTQSLAWSPDGQQFLLGHWRGKADLWDFGSGRQIRVFEGHSPSSFIRSVAFSLDGRWILTTSDDSAVLWDARTGEKLRSFSGGRSLNAAISPDSSRILTGPCEGEEYAASRDARSGQLLQKFGTGNVVAFSPDGRRVFNGLALWDATNGQHIQALSGETDSLRDVRFSPDGKRLLVTCGPTTVLWNLSAAAIERTFPAGNLYGIDEAAFDATGQKVLTLKRHTGAVVWDAVTGEQLGRFDEKVTGATPVTGVMSPDGAQVLMGLEPESVGSGRGQVSLWDVAAGRKVRDLAGTFKFLECLALSHDGRWAAASHDDKVTLWNVATGQRVRSFDQGDAGVSCRNGVEFAPDGQRLLVKGLDTATVWETATGRRLKKFAGVDFESMSCATFSPDASQVLVGHVAGTVRLYDAATERVLRTLRGHTFQITTLAFSSDGQRVLTGSRDNTLRCWSVATGEELFRLMMLNDGQDWIVATPEGLFDASEGARQKVSFRIGGGLNVVPVDRFFQDFYRPGLMAAIWNDRAALPEMQIGKRLPPVVKILSPTTGEVETQEVTLEVEATDQGGGISALTLYQNGARVLAPGEKRQDGKTLHRTFRVSLIEGENRLRVASATDDGSWESEPAEIVLRHAKPLAKSQLHLVVVGINQYADANLNLSFAAKDALALAELFQRRGKSLYEQVHLTSLVDSQATKAGIQEALKEVGAKTRPQDTLVLFLAGHGTMIGQRYYFIPHELRKQAERLEDDIRTQGLPADELSDYLGSAAALKRILILDTCASGGALGVVLKGRSGFELRGAIERLGRTQGIFTIAASAASEQAQEAKELGHGVLSYALLAGLKGVDAGPLADKHVQPSGPERVVDVMDWFSFASGQVPRLTERYYGVSQDVQTSTQGASFPVLPLEE